MNKEIKKSARTGKRVFYDILATEAGRHLKRETSALCTRSPELSLPRSPTKTYQSNTARDILSPRRKARSIDGPNISRSF
ncbi:hypothetical protein DPMN_075936 [Dreissena polymorpha]|uniref:Uncharacterized protein n=1 Tax=Dreissena polymorpha TaxID=45954 RepID=A0A9D4BLY5_DREPO|nr:hypothetical protein DPMN_075936 [Dreissena polymorpha]